MSITDEIKRLDRDNLYFMYEKLTDLRNSYKCHSMCADCNYREACRVTQLIKEYVHAICVIKGAEGK